MIITLYLYYSRRVLCAVKFPLLSSGFLGALLFCLRFADDQFFGAEWVAVLPSCLRPFVPDFIACFGTVILLAVGSAAWLRALLHKCSVPLLDFPRSRLPLQVLQPLLVCYTTCVFLFYTLAVPSYPTFFVRHPTSLLASPYHLALALSFFRPISSSHGGLWFSILYCILAILFDR